MNKIEKEVYEDNINFIKENFEPVEDKPGYVWFSKRNLQIINIETFAKLLQDTWARKVKFDDGSDSIFVENSLAKFEKESEDAIGQWIDDKCSVCGKGIEDLIDSSDWYQLEDPKYCPFCGIKIGGWEE